MEFLEVPRHFLVDLVRSGQIWPDLIRSGQIWPDLVRSGQISSDLVRSGQIWPDPVRSGQISSDLVRPGQREIPESRETVAYSEMQFGGICSVIFLVKSALHAPMAKGAIRGCTSSEFS